ncbi:MAG TPA: GNAT family N-acetyltransferase [Ktedonobacterales bacterium]|nr:GNAT family N-acetyltransferase [Ktedonobacterales bacterium]
MATSHLQFLELQVDALFTHDSTGNIVAINEPDGGPAPRFFLGRSQVGNLWRVRHDLPEVTARSLHALAADVPVSEDLRAEPHNMAAFLEALRADQEIRSVWSGPAYRFPDTLPALAAHVTRITRANLYLLRQMDWNQTDLARDFEHWEPMVAVVEDDAAVSLCFSSRLTARAAEAGVETMETYRGRGHASTVVTSWAHAVRATGRVPLYSTSWDNRASQAVARILGLVQYGADLSVR